MNNYIGPRAIYDQNYIPPKILHREREELNLYSILRDSLSDGFCLNILYQGIQGIGKKVIINKVIQDLTKQKENSKNINKVVIDCYEKSINEVFFSIFTEICSISNIKIDFNRFLNSNLSELWYFFKLICNKFSNDLIFVFNNIEYLKPEYYKKFLQYGKESKISFISTVNKVINASTLDILNQFDLKIKLSYYNFNELFDIIEQRVALTFLNGIEKELIEFITDLIFEHYVPVPGKAINILRELYPIFSHQNEVNKLEVIEILQNQFDSINLSDEFDIINYLSDEDIITIIFLDNLANFFIKSPNYYIELDDMKELYFITCESIEYTKKIEVFNELIKDLHNIGIINFSKKLAQISLKSFKNISLNNEFYFIAINPKQLKAMVDAIFEKS